MSEEAPGGRAPSASNGSGWMMVMVVPVAATGLMTLVGWRSTSARGGSAAVLAMFAAQAVVLGAVYLTVLPMASRMRAADSPTRLKLGFQAGGVRLIATMAAAIGVVVTELVEKRPFLLWIGLYYVVTTLAETIALTRWMRNTGKQA